MALVSSRSVSYADTRLSLRSNPLPGDSSIPFSLYLSIIIDYWEDGRPATLGRREGRQAGRLAGLV